MKRIAFLSILIATVCFGRLFAQQTADFIRPFFGYYNSQSIPVGVGGASVAAGYLAPGKTSNPANIGLHKFVNIQTNILIENFESASTDLSHTRIGNLYAILPIQVYQGSLAFGLGFNREVDFSNGKKSDNFRYTEEGGLYSLDFACSVEFARNLFLGGDISYLFGENEATTWRRDEASSLNPKYRGIGWSVGFVHKTTPNLQIGVSIDFPTYLWVDDELTTWIPDSSESTEWEIWEYRLTSPMTFHIGGAFLLRYVDLFYEMEWADWKNLDFASETYFGGDVLDINREIEEDVKSTLTHHIGAAFHPMLLPMHFYAGYQYMPVPYRGNYDSNRRQMASLGFSYLLTQQFSVHGSYANYFWKYRDAEESFTQLIAGVSMHY